MCKWFSCVPAQCQEHRLEETGQYTRMVEGVGVTEGQQTSNRTSAVLSSCKEGEEDCQRSTKWPLGWHSCACFCPNSHKQTPWGESEGLSTSSALPESTRRGKIFPADFCSRRWAQVHSVQNILLPATPPSITKSVIMHGGTSLECCTEPPPASQRYLNGLDELLTPGAGSYAGAAGMEMGFFHLHNVSAVFQQVLDNGSLMSLTLLLWPVVLQMLRPYTRLKE